MKFNSFTRYGIELKRLTENELEMLRSWRNDPKVSVFMAQQNGKVISKEEQIVWFNNIKDKNDAFYYIGYYKNKPIGYTAIKNIDWNKGYGEPGNIAVCDNPFVTMFRTLAGFDLFFEEMDLKYLYADFRNTNKKIKKFSSLFGYEYVCTNGDFEMYGLKKEIYFSKRAEILKKFSL